MFLEKILIVLLGCLLFCQCSQITFANELPTEVPKCIQTEIRKIDQEAPAGRQVWLWEIENEYFYLITSGCCDLLHHLVDGDCNNICSPSGGFNGFGDGSCPIFEQPILKTLVWEGES